ncbi:hypothetical protein EJP617_C170 (plasmid) [Erwinia sp. Ejp617]|nr:hypothetical protein EJP617_C170 [Erwinia sp. Ejp617]
MMMACRSALAPRSPLRSILNTPVAGWPRRSPHCLRRWRKSRWLLCVNCAWCLPQSARCCWKP